ncbi:MAG TPA: hypothetical protein VGJ54_20370, partial [Streptosporangiaceae bacterium]
MITTRNARPVFTIAAERGAQGPVIRLGGPAGVLTGRRGGGPYRQMGRWSLPVDGPVVRLGGPV